MTMQTLTAVFTSRYGAIAAASELRRRGLSGTVTLSPEVASPSETRGFRAWLESLFSTAADKDAYSDSLARGETILTALVGDAGVHEALGVLDHHLSIRADRCRPSSQIAHDREVRSTDGIAAGRGAPDAAFQPVRRQPEPEASHPPHRPGDRATLSTMARDLAALPSRGEDSLSQTLSRTWEVRAGMEVVGSDGCRVGVVDTVSRDAVVLSVDALTGRRRQLAEDWVKAVDMRVTLKLSGADTMRCWVPAD